MPTLTYHPKLPSDAPAGGPFTQEVRLTEGRRVLGAVTWHTVGPDGVVQVLDLFVREPERRRGHGTTLLQAVEAQARVYHGRMLRRIWCTLRQQSHVVGRALFSSRGFQHVGTLKDLYRGEDALLYAKTYD